MSKPAAKKNPRKKNGYVMPEAIPLGEVLSDVAKKKWILGPSIGKGGFGEIYSAAEYTGSNKITNYTHVIKIEPHGNGPLFVEMHFYMRNAKPNDIDNFCTTKKSRNFGMPRYIGSGSHECHGNKYRFLVLDRYGKDLWNLYLENNRCFPAATVYKIGIQMLDVLEYIHSKGYVHADIKGANALLGLTKSTQDQVYLLDYGLASHYTTKEFKPDPKKAHNGTIEYTSRDAHLGVPTRRGDLEILAYNLIHWLGCTLPWEKCLTDPSSVQAIKEKSFQNIPEFLKKCFGQNKVPGQLSEYLKYVNKMKYDTNPDYNKLRALLVSALEDNGGALKDPLKFKQVTSKHKLPSKTPTPDKKRKVTKKTSNLSRNELKQPRDKTEKEKSDSSDSDEEHLNGYTPAMLKIIQGRKEPKNMKKNARNQKVDSPKAVVSEDDIIDETPPKRQRTRIKVRKNYKEESNEDVPTKKNSRRMNSE